MKKAQQSKKMKTRTYTNVVTQDINVVVAGKQTSAASVSISYNEIFLDKKIVDDCLEISTQLVADKIAEELNRTDVKIV